MYIVAIHSLHTHFKELFFSLVFVLIISKYNKESFKVKRLVTKYCLLQHVKKDFIMIHIAC